MASRDAPSEPGGDRLPARGMGSRSGVRLRMMPLADFEWACAELERDVRGQALRGLTVTLEVDRAPTVPQLRRMEELLLDRHGAQLLQVVEVAEVSPDPGVAGRPPTGTADRVVDAVVAREEREPDEAAPPAGRAGGRGGWPAEGALRGGTVVPDGRRTRTRGHRPRVAGRGAGAANGTLHSDGRQAPGTPAPAWPSTEGPGAMAGPSGALPAEPVPTMLIKRTLRSGQRIRFAGNVVVLGDVNPGAEVVAAGDIVVMGTLRGVAHAGATGGTEAIVAAFRLHPTQLRVGAVIGRAPDGLIPRPEAPEVARVRDGVLVVERYVP